MPFVLPNHLFEIFGSVVRPAAPIEYSRVEDILKTFSATSALQAVHVTRSEWKSTKIAAQKGMHERVT